MQYNDKQTPLLKSTVIYGQFKESVNKNTYLFFTKYYVSSKNVFGQVTVDITLHINQANKNE